MLPATLAFAPSRWSTVAAEEHDETARRQTSDELKRRRVLTVRGSAEERGAALGVILGASMADLTELRQGLYSTKGLALWASLASNAEASWRERAPISWAELQGMRRAGFVSQDQLCMLGSDFEMQMCSWMEAGLYKDEPKQPQAQPPPGRCTAFALTDAKGLSHRGPLCGQNVDEEPQGWLDGSRDVVIRHFADPGGAPDTLLYTHPGVPAYCGMNSAGLAVMNLYIDDGLRNESGVPIDVALREVLSYRDITEAVAYLESLPRMAPTTFMLMQGEVIGTVEASARRSVTSWLRGPGEVFHANHAILDQRMAGDVEEGTSSAQRFCQIRDSVRAARGNFGVDDAQRILRDIPPAHLTIAPTIARVVMDPTVGFMHVLFRGDTEWIAVGFVDDVL